MLALCFLSCFVTPLSGRAKIFLVTIPDKRLIYQIDTLQLVTKYFDVIVWCLDVGLLPEKVASSSDRCIPTYMMSLMQYTEQR